MGHFWPYLKVVFCKVCGRNISKVVYQWNVATRPISFNDCFLILFVPFCHFYLSQLVTFCQRCAIFAPTVWSHFAKVSRNAKKLSNLLFGSNRKREFFLQLGCNFATTNLFEKNEDGAVSAIFRVYFVIGKILNPIEPFRLLFVVVNCDKWKK